MDLSKNMAKGRKIASDLKRGNKTLVIIKALENGSKKQRGYILKVLGNENASSSEIRKTIKIIGKTGAVLYASGFAETKILEAKDCLKKANLNKKYHDFFMSFADYAIKRKE